MGREVAYCAKCGQKLTETTFGEGKAVRVKEIGYCLGCAPIKPPTYRTPNHVTPLPITRRLVTKSSGWTRSQIGFLAGATSLVIVLVFVCGVSYGQRKSSPILPPPEPERGALPQKLEGPVPPAEVKKSNTEPPVTKKSEPAPPPPVEPPKPTLEQELANLDAAVAGLTVGENFWAAFEELQRAKERHGEPEWTNAVEQRAKKLEVTVDALFERLKVEIRAAARDKDAAKVQSILARVKAWGMNEVVEVLRMEAGQD